MRVSLGETESKAKMKYYSKTNSNPKGAQEDPERCVVAIIGFAKDSWQCTTHREKDGLCEKHLKNRAKGWNLNIPEDEVK